MVVEWVRASADQPAFLLEELPVGLPERGLDVGVGGAAVAGHGRDVAGRHHVHLQVTLDHRHGDAQLRVFACLGTQYLLSTALWETSGTRQTLLLDGKISSCVGIRAFMYRLKGILKFEDTYLS